MPRLHDLNARRSALMQRIARRRQEHAPVAAELARLQEATVQQLRAEIRARKRERRNG